MIFIRKGGDEILKEKNNLYVDKNNIYSNIDINLEQISAENVSTATLLYFKKPEQKFKQFREFTLSRDVFDDFIRNFKNNKNGELPINYNHRVSDIASGWLKDIWLEEDAEYVNLVGKIEWTDKALEKLKSKEYKYFSAEFTLGQFKLAETGEIMRNVLTGGALTNKPFLTRARINLENEGDVKMNKQELINELRQYDLDVDAISLENTKNLEKLNSLTLELENTKKEADKVRAEFDNFKLEQEKIKIGDLLGDMIEKGKSSQELNDKVYKVMFENIGYEKAKEMAELLPVVAKFERVSGSDSGTEMTDEQKIEQLAESQKVTFEVAADMFYRNENTKEG